MQSQLITDIESRPWTVIVRDGCVFRKYRTDRSPSDLRESLATEMCGVDDVEVYAVHENQEPPPDEGTPVDPEWLEWRVISQGDHQND